MGGAGEPGGAWGVPSTLPLAPPEVGDTGEGTPPLAMGEGDADVSGGSLVAVVVVEGAAAVEVVVVLLRLLRGVERGAREE